MKKIWAEKMTEILVKRGCSPNGISLFGMFAAIVTGISFGCTSFFVGGLLDRFDSLLLVAPVVFHFINYFKSDGIGGDQTGRILTGGW